MAASYSPEDLGEPALKIGGFQLWINGRQFPDATDYDDGNWLTVTAHCGGSGASVWTSGSILQSQNILGLAKDCRALAAGKASRAGLIPLEPEIQVVLEATDRIGHIKAQVDITPDHLTQEHKFTFEIDQSYLPGVIKACDRILEEYPVRGLESPSD